MNFFLLSSVISLSLAAPAPEAEAKAALVHPVLAHHVAPLAVVPAKQLQWPGITAPGVDSTCFGCRSAVVVGRKRREAEADAEAEAALVHPVLAHHVAPLAVVPAKQLQWPGITAPGVDSTCFGCRHAVVVGRKRREAEAVAEADADAEAEATAEAAAAPFYPLAVAPHYPYHVPAVALRSSGYATVNNAGVSYSTGVHAVHVLPLGRRRREAEAEADADAEAEAEADAEADADAEAKVEALGVAPVTSLNGYIHNLGSGNSYAAISSGPSYPFVHAVAPFPYPYLG